MLAINLLMQLVVHGYTTYSLADNISDHIASDSERSSEEEVSQLDENMLSHNTCDGVNNEDEQNSGINIA